MLIFNLQPDNIEYLSKKRHIFKIIVIWDHKEFYLKFRVARGNVKVPLLILKL
jgi:hypothetical protein